MKNNRLHKVSTNDLHNYSLILYHAGMRKAYRDVKELHYSSLFNDVYTRTDGMSFIVVVWYAGSIHILNTLTIQVDGKTKSNSRPHSSQA